MVAWYPLAGLGTSMLRIYLEMETQISTNIYCVVFKLKLAQVTSLILELNIISITLLDV